MNKTLRNALIAAAAAVVLVLILPFLVPLDAYRGRIESAAEHATGRAFRIEGPLRLMLFPHLGLKAYSVVLANVPGGRAAALVRVGDIRLSVRLLPLFAGHVALDKIVLDEPAIALEVDAAGNANWRFAREKNQASGESPIGLPSGAKFAGLEISDGRIAYDNLKTDTHRALDHVNAAIAITRLDLPASVKGDLTYRRQKIDFEAHLATLKTLLGNGTTALDLSARSELMRVGFKGLLQQNGATDGTFTLQSPSFRNLVAWLDEPLPGGGLGVISLEGHVRSQAKVTEIDHLRLSLDRQNMTGNLRLERYEVPVLTASLAVDRLDLTPLLAAGNGSAPQRDERRSGTGWSKSPINFGLLKKADVQIDFNAGAVLVRDLRLGKTLLRVNVDGGVLNADFGYVSLYGGTGKAQLEIDDRGRVPVFRQAMSVSNISLRPFLADTLGVDSIEGNGALTMNISSTGNSADAIMHALSGKGVISANQGRFRRVDLGLVARSIRRVLGDGATGEGAATDFHTMHGSFVILNGVMMNNDFGLAGPVVQMTGRGQIDFGERTIDFRLVPAASVQGVSVGIPFRVYGSWDRVHYVPDVADIVSGVVQNFQNGRAAFKGLFGGNGRKDGKKKKNVGDALKGVFGLH